MEEISSPIVIFPIFVCRSPNFFWNDQLVIVLDVLLRTFLYRAIG